MARNRRSGQNISGVILLDKRIGISSNAALQEVKKLFHARKAGHTGSLDPLASGLLLVCLGEATKISSFWLNTDKRYRVKVKLGLSTATGDSEGEIVERKPIPDLNENAIVAVLEKFNGEITQVPPMYSALKHNGTRLYELARQGIDVERKARTVTIFGLSLLHYSDETLELDVHCSKGTYIRTLAEDIADAMGSCGHVEELRRTRVGEFALADEYKFEDLECLSRAGDLHNSLVSVVDALKSWPSVCLSDELAFFVKQGQAVFSPKAPKERWVKLLTQNKHFFGIGEIRADGKVAPRRLMNV